MRSVDFLGDFQVKYIVSLIVTIWLSLELAFLV